ncbi:hypothetical protein Ancab_000226 [Ancistrocladus abbreviatus]
MKNKFFDLSGTPSNGKEIFNNDGNPNSLTEETKRPICSICNKEFPSNKSLFGHMKCHQKIDRRGIQLPPIGGDAGNSYCQTVLDALRRSYPVGFEMEAADCPGTNLFRSLPLGWERGNGGVGNVILQRNSALEELKFTNNDTKDSSEIRRKAKGKVVLKDESLLNLAKLDFDDEYWLRDECSDEDGNFEQHTGVL